MWPPVHINVARGSVRTVLIHVKRIKTKIKKKERKVVSVSQWCHTEIPGTESELIISTKRNLLRVKALSRGCEDNKATHSGDVDPKDMIGEGNRSGALGLKHSEERPAVHFLDYSIGSTQVRPVTRRWPDTQKSSLRLFICDTVVKWWRITPSPNIHLHWD